MKKSDVSPTFKQVFRLFVYHALFVVMAGVFLLDQLGQRHLVSWPFQPMLRVFFQAEVAARDWSRQVRQFVKGAVSASGQLDHLQRRNAVLQAQVAQSEFLLQENNRLRQQIELQSARTSVQNGLVSRVVRVDQQMIIDHGSNDGVKPKDLVFHGDVLIGQVSDVSQIFSTVELLIGTLRTPVIVNAQIGGVLASSTNGLVIEHITADKQVRIGDIVLTAGSKDQMIPQGLYIGQVSEVSTSPDGTVLRVHVEQAEYDILTGVVVIRSPEQAREIISSLDSDRVSEGGDEAEQQPDQNSTDDQEQ